MNLLYLNFENVGESEDLNLNQGETGMEGEGEGAGEEAGEPEGNQDIDQPNEEGHEENNSDGGENAGIHNVDNNQDFQESNNQGNGNINVLNLERETAKKVSELYPKKEEVKPKFKASPVISPVYGVLDKNYTKEEVREKTDDNNTMKRPSKKVDFETVRKKAFGNLADEIKDNMLCENCELYKEVKKISALSEDDLLYDMTVDEEEKEVTLEKAYDNYREFGVAYEPKTIKKIEVPESEVEEEKELELPKEFENIINNTNVEEDKVAYTPLKDKIDDQKLIDGLVLIIEKNEIYRFIFK